MQISDAEAKLLANVIYELRLCLASYLGPSNDGPVCVRIAAHMAYSMHNQALAILNGKPFDVSESLKSLRHIDEILGITDMATIVDRTEAMISRPR